MWRNTDCRIVSDQLWNYVAHRLSEQEVERVERHLSLCDACRAEADAYRLTVDGLASARMRPIPQSRRGWHELQARLSEVPASQRAVNRLRWNIPQLAWGAAASAAVLAVFMLPRPASPPADSNVASRGSQTAAPGTIVPGVVTVQPGGPQEGVVPRPNVPITLPRAADASKHVIARTGSSPFHASRPSLKWTPAADVRGGARLAIHRPRKHTAPVLDYAHMDGRRSANPGERAEYVLTPVGASTDSDSAPDYVMGSIAMSGRAGGFTTVSNDTEEARGW